MSEPAFADQDASLSEDRLSDVAPVGLLRLGAGNLILEANSAAADLLGRSLEAFLGEPLSDVLYPDAVIFDLVARSRRNQRDTMASRVVLKGPETETAPLDIRIGWPDDGTVCAAFWRSPLSRVSEAAASLGDFAKIFGHEVKTPLAAISGAAQLLAQGNPDDGSRELLDLIVSEAERLERVIGRLTDLETLRAPKRSDTNIHEIIDRIIEAERLKTGNGVDFVRNFDPSLPQLHVDPDHIHQALQNLVRNAVDACAKSEHPRVEIETHFAMGARLPGRRERGAFAVSVIDNGHGIPADKLQSVFDPFFTTKVTGTGIGLSVVRDVVNGHGGALDVSSWPGTTRFTVHLPLSQQKADTDGDE